LRDKKEATWNRIIRGGSFLALRAASYAIANFDVLDVFTKSDNLTGNIAPIRPWEGSLWTIISR
jgi:hypothetical protein